MRGNWAVWVLAAAILCLGRNASAQTAPAKLAPAPSKATPAPGGVNPFGISEVRTYWNSSPVVGSNAVYEIAEADGKKSTQEFEILSEETIEWKKAYWLEIAVDDAMLAKKLYAKSLVIPADYQMRKQIIQFQGAAAMEMPLSTQPVIPKADLKTGPRVIGRESVTVPGGTFECEHWREADGTEAWVSEKVGPLKLVKLVRATQTWVLQKTGSHATEYITGPVKAFDPEVMKKLVEPASRQ